MAPRDQNVSPAPHDTTQRELDLLPDFWVPLIVIDNQRHLTQPEEPLQYLRELPPAQLLELLNSTGVSLLRTGEDTEPNTAQGGRAESTKK